MVEEQRVRIDEAMEKMIEEIDKYHIRTLQGQMFKCSAKCCEDSESSMRSVQKCIQTCARPLESANSYFSSELSHFQDRLQRCIMTCNDTIRDKIGSETKESVINKYTKEFDSCATKCVDAHINLIPDMLKKIKEVMKREKY